MNKPYLLIAGDSHYPSADTGDWIGCFSTIEEAREQIEYIDHPRFFTQGKMKGQLKSNHITYKIGDREFDWYHIEDLREWTEQ
jgi:hypothetical protein